MNTSKLVKVHPLFYPCYSFVTLLLMPLLMRCYLLLMRKFHFIANKIKHATDSQIKFWNVICESVAMVFQAKISALSQNRIDFLREKSQNQNGVWYLHSMISVPPVLPRTGSSASLMLPCSCCSILPRHQRTG